jgi:manganese/zinc/iron transport system substrate-binding protein
MKTALKAFSSIICLLLVLTSCTSGQRCEREGQRKTWNENNGRLKVLCTIAMIEDLVREIGGENVDTWSLIRGQMDPHTYQLVKGDGEQLDYADCVFYHGLNLEHGPSLKQFLVNNDKAVAVADAIAMAFPERILYVNQELDPHLWMDVSLWLEGIDVIVKTLSDLKPEFADAFAARGEKLRSFLRNLHDDLRSICLKIPSEKRFIVTSHDAFNYFARAYLADEKETEQSMWGIRVMAPEGLAPDSQLSPVDIQLMIDHLKTFQIHVLFTESNVNPDSIRKIVDAGREKGLDLVIADATLYADAMGCPGSPGDSYQEMMQHNVNVISKYIRENTNSEVGDGS